MSSCVHDFEPWWCELDCPECPLELLSPESDWPELPDGISPSNSGVIIIMLSLSTAFFELTLARSDIWLSMSIVSEESIVCNVSNLILISLSQFWISINKPRKRNMIYILLASEKFDTINSTIYIFGVEVFAWKLRGKVFMVPENR